MRLITHIGLSLVFAFSTMNMAQASQASEQLTQRLTQYVAAFDAHALDAQAKEKLRRILDKTGLSHGQKVLAVHSILSEQDALRHVDMHGTEKADLNTAIPRTPERALRRNALERF